MEKKGDDINNLYSRYIKIYQECTSGYDQIIRGIMHYKHVEDDIFLNTTLFGRKKNTVSLIDIRYHQDIIQKKTLRLYSLLTTIQSDTLFQQSGISTFLEQNIKKTCMLLDMVQHGTLWIEAEKGGYSLDAQLKSTASALTTHTFQYVLGNSLLHETKQVKNIARHIFSLEFDEKDYSHLGDWSELVSHTYGSEKKLKYNNKKNKGNKYMLDAYCVLFTIVSCIRILLSIRGENKVVALLIHDRVELEEDLLYTHLPEIDIYTEHTYEKDPDIFYISVGRKGWKMGNNIFFVPEKGLKISLGLLCEILDHEIATHETTTFANQKSLAMRSHGYRKDEEGMAIFNQRLVRVNHPNDLKKTPTYHHIASLMGEYFTFYELKKCLKEYFLASGEAKTHASRLSISTALKVKRYMPFDSKRTNRFLLQYTQGYYDLLDLYRTSKAKSDGLFPIMRRQLHLGKFNRRDLVHIQSFLEHVRKDETKVFPIYFGRLLYQYIVNGKGCNDIITEDIRYKRTKIPNKKEIRQLANLCEKIKILLKE